MSKLIKFTMVGGGPNNPNNPNSYNPQGGLTTPMYVNIDRVRAISYDDGGNYPFIKVWIQGGGAGYNNVTTQSIVVKIYGISNPTSAERIDAGQRAVEAFAGILENTNQDPNIIEFPFVQGWNAKAGECLSMDIVFNK